MNPKGNYICAIRCVEEMRQRCRIDEDTGCWHWGGGMYDDGTPSVSFIFEGKRMAHKGRKAALLLSTGKPLPKGHVAFQGKNCKSRDCVNPAHCRSSTRANWGQYMAASGRATSISKTVNAIANGRVKARLTPEEAALIRISGESVAELAARYAVSVSHIKRIRAGQHWRENVRGASVFTFRPQLKEAA